MLLWTNSISNNIQGLPEQLIQYVKLINSYMYASHADYYDTDALVPYHRPCIYMRNMSTDINVYTSLFLLPLAINGVKITVTSYPYAEQITETDIGINFYYRDSNYHVEHNLGLSELIGAHVEIDGYKMYIKVDSEDKIYKLMHKAVACLYNLLLNGGFKFDAYPFDSKLYTELYNYRIDKFLQLYSDWLESFYHVAETTYDERQYNAVIKTLVTGSATKIKRQLDSIQNDISRYESELATLYSRKATQQKLYIGAKYNVSDERVDELTDIFKRCNNLKYVSTSNGCVYLKFITPLFNYDQDLAERWCNSENNPFADNHVQDLMYKLIVDGKYTLLLECRVYWNVDSLSISNDNSYACTEACPQPHLVNYNCFGEYRSNIQEALADGDYSLALDWTNASTSSINIQDHPVVSKWINWLKSNSNQDLKCVVNNETGELVSLKEVIADDTITRTRS